MAVTWCHHRVEPRSHGLGGPYSKRLDKRYQDSETQSVSCDNPRAISSLTAGQTGQLNGNPLARSVTIALLRRRNGQNIRPKQTKASINLSMSPGFHLHASIDSIFGAHSHQGRGLIHAVLCIRTNYHVQKVKHVTRATVAWLSTAVLTIYEYKEVDTGKFGPTAQRSMSRSQQDPSSLTLAVKKLAGEDSGTGDGV